MTQLRQVSWLDVVVIVYQVLFLLLAGYIFHVQPNTPIFERFSRDLHININSEFFATLCLVCIPLSIAVFRFKQVWVKRYLYITASSPLILYLFPVGYVAWVENRLSIGILAYVFFFAAFIIIAFATFREMKIVERPAYVPTNNSTTS